MFIVLVVTMADTATEAAVIVIEEAAVTAPVSAKDTAPVTVTLPPAVTAGKLSMLPEKADRLDTVISVPLVPHCSCWVALRVTAAEAAVMRLPPRQLKVCDAAALSEDDACRYLDAPRLIEGAASETVVVEVDVMVESSVMDVPATMLNIGLTMAPELENDTVVLASTVSAVVAYKDELVPDTSRVTTVKVNELVSHTRPAFVRTASVIVISPSPFRPVYEAVVLPLLSTFKRVMLATVLLVKHVPAAPYPAADVLALPPNASLSMVLDSWEA